MTIDMVAAALPPQVNGIGDYTANLARALAGRCRVRVLTAQGPCHDPIPGGVGISPLFSPGRRHSVLAIADEVAAERPDWLILQYNPFAFGRWGLNPYLPATLRRIRRQSKGTQIALMAHETFVPISNWKCAVMTTWQRWQLWALGRAADVVLFSIEPWAIQFRQWFRDRPLYHLPVGSNIPRVSITREEARSRLDISSRAFVLGLFGAAGRGRALEHIRAAAAAVSRAGREVLLLYVGQDGAALRAAVDGVPVRDEGALPAGEVSRRMAAMDLYLAPYVDGVSTRRTSFMTGLQHGTATLGTVGPLTDRELRAEAGHAFLLADVRSPASLADHARCLVGDADLRRRLGQRAEQLYDDYYAWDRIASQLLNILCEAPMRELEACR